MDYSTNHKTYIDCSHFNYAYDYHEGTEVCMSCGLVLAPLFITKFDQHISKTDSNSEKEKQKIQEIEDILDMMHISRIYSNFIFKYFTKNFTVWNVKTTVFCIFKVLNDMGYSISMRELVAVTNVEKKKLSSAQPNNENVEVSFDNIAEKYCQLLKLPFKTITLIKDKIIKSPMTGHNPNSVIASVIYNTLKKEKQKISLKKISNLTNVSCISIQRYNKVIRDVSPSR